MLGRERAETSPEPEPELAVPQSSAQSSVTLAVTPAFLTGTVQLLGCCLLPSPRYFIPATRSEQGDTHQTQTPALPITRPLPQVISDAITSKGDRDVCQTRQTGLSQGQGDKELETSLGDNIPSNFNTAMLSFIKLMIFR